MPNTWFTADFHLGHGNIIRYCQRPFLNVAEMDDAILENLDAVVREQDDLYYLGDFCLASAQRPVEYRKRIRCKNIYFVEGNHDAAAWKIRAEFRWWKALAEAKIGAQVLVLCHYAMRVWNESLGGAWHLYGHSHGRLPEDPASLSMDVGIDTHDFRPWHFDEIQARMKDKRTAIQPAAFGVELSDELP